MYICLFVVCLRGKRENMKEKNIYYVSFSVLSDLSFSEDMPSYTIDVELFKPNSAESSDMHLS